MSSSASVPSPIPNPSPNLWDSFWMRRVPPHALALVRIALGLYMLVYAGLYVPNLSILFSSEGLVFPLYVDDVSPVLHFLFAAQSVLVTHVVYGVYLLCLVGMTLGYRFRLSVGLALLFGVYYWQLQLHMFPASYNRILLLCHMVMLFSGAAETFSVDAKRRFGSALAWRPISILPQRLITLQITFTFLGVGLQKWWLPHWKGGEILSYSFISRWSTPFGRWFARLPLDLWVYDSIVWVVKFVQPVASFGVWVPKIRIPCVVFLTGFLLLITVMMSIWWFVFIIPAWILFWDPTEIFSLLQHKYPKIPADPVD